MFKGTGMKRAFTLAEMLIVISIIGIIAEMTLVDLVLDAQTTRYKAGWKKAYSALATVTNTIVNEQGGSLVGLFSDNNTFRDYYKDKLSWIKSCDDSITERCYSYTTLAVNGRSSPVNNSGQPALVLKDGSLLWFQGASTVCSSAYSDCGKIMVDVNGNNSPNLVGVDIFAGYIKYNTTAGTFLFTPLAEVTGGPCTPCTASSCDSYTTLRNGYYCSLDYLLNN